jgi:macrolide-specific efflux system membrane fusion protein
MYRTVEVRRGDVIRYVNITANYVPAQEESLAFEIGDEYIHAVYVDIGDNVQAGDIVAELDRTYFQNELERLAREESWTRLSLSQLETRHEMRLAEAMANDSQVDESAYIDERASLLTQLETHRIRREYLMFEDERRILRAGLNGMVMTALAFSEGMTSTANRNIITIADQSNSVFMVRGPDSVHLEMGKHYDMSINWEPYTGEIVDAESLGISRTREDEKYLMLVGDEPEILSARTFATVRLVLEEARDVLYVPFSVVKKANNRVFVYVINDGVRQIRDIEIGLEGNTTTQIISGLLEGEEVVQE